MTKLLDVALSTLRNTLNTHLTIQAELSGLGAPDSHLYGRTTATFAPVTHQTRCSQDYTILFKDFEKPSGLSGHDQFLIDETADRYRDSIAHVQEALDNVRRAILGNPHLYTTPFGLTLTFRDEIDAPALSLHLTEKSSDDTTYECVYIPLENNLSYFPAFSLVCTLLHQAKGLGKGDWWTVGALDFCDGKNFPVLEHGAVVKATNEQDAILMTLMRNFNLPVSFWQKNTKLYTWKNSGFDPNSLLSTSRQEKQHLPS